MQLGTFNETFVPSKNPMRMRMYHTHSSSTLFHSTDALKSKTKEDKFPKMSSLLDMSRRSHPQEQRSWGA
jgi:hypothetical protein